MVSVSLFFQHPGTNEKCALHPIIGGSHSLWRRNTPRASKSDRTFRVDRCGIPCA